MFDVWQYNYEVSDTPCQIKKKKKKRIKKEKKRTILIMGKTLLLTTYFHITKTGITSRPTWTIPVHFGVTRLDSEKCPYY